MYNGQKRTQRGAGTAGGGDEIGAVLRVKGLAAVLECFSSNGLELISITDSYAAAGVQSYHFTYPMAPTQSKPAWQVCAEIGSELLRSPKNQIS